MITNTSTAMHIRNKAIVSGLRRTISVFTEHFVSNPNTRYDFIQQLADLKLKGLNQSIDHCNMTEVIRYKTSYFVDKTFYLFSFPLGNDVALRSVLDIPNPLTIDKLSVQ